jgi:hypothetical protein
MSSIWHLLTRCKNCLLPLTSLLTVAVVSYISFVYITVFLPMVSQDANQRAIPNLSWAIGAIFVMFPSYIFTALFFIVFSDPGYMTKKLQSDILKKNGIEEDDLGRTITMREALCLLTQNYLSSQGIDFGDIESRTTQSINDTNITATLHDQTIEVLDQTARNYSSRLLYDAPASTQEIELNSVANQLPNHILDGAQSETRPMKQEPV